MDNRIVLVTGGASGIGAAISERFAQEGAYVVIADLNEKRGVKLKDRLGDHALFLKTDVSEEASFVSTIGTVLKQFGRIDSLINNAGIPGPGGSIADVPIKEFDAAIAVLFRSVFLGMQLVAPGMKEQRAGTIVNMSSLAGFITNGDHVYSAAKAAIIHLTRSVALELAEFGIRVNCICPGAIATPLYGKHAGLNEEESERTILALRDLLKNAQPLPHAGLPEDIANVAFWLASEESCFMTGQAIVVDGGLSLGQGWKQTRERRDNIRSYLQRALTVD